jgi:hypothetical protein
MKKKPGSKEVMKVFDDLPEDVKNTLEELLEQAKSKEEFLQLAMVGGCPFCGGTNTRDCDETPLGDITVGICLDCHRLWCLECGYKFPEGKTMCEHWAICEDCEFIDEKKESCGTPPFECSILREKLDLTE